MSVVVERDEQIAVITLDRPERRNAVDHATLRSLLAAQAELRADAPRTVRAVVLTGAPPAFSAGADLHGVDENEFARDLAAVLRGFGELPVPVIAAIDGPALGAGAQLAVASDLRVATPGSMVGVPAARLGLVVDHWTVRRLAAEFTPAVARAMLLGAEVYTGERLYQVGAVHRLGGLLVAIGWAHDLARLAPLTISGHKLALDRVLPDPAVVEEVEAARRAAWSSQDAEEGRSAFLEKRPPDFTGT